MRYIFGLVFLSLFSPLSLAQKGGFFSVEAKGGSSSLRLSDMETDVKIKGAFAETTLELAYYNDSNNALQGLFKIELPKGSVVRDFALKIHDQWQLGSLIEKHKARTTF